MREEWQFIPDTWVTHRAFCEESKRALEECNLMDERFKVIARLLNGEKMAVLCREFGISRKSGYKPDGLRDARLAALGPRR